MRSLLWLPALIHLVSGRTFNYSELHKWKGFCQQSADPTTPQQSPINIDSSKATTFVDLSITNLHANQVLLSQNIYDHSEAGIIMILEAATEHKTTFRFKDIDYHLDHIHSHWGASEHLTDDRQYHGSIHLVFMGETPQGLWTPLKGNAAVLEINVLFVPEKGNDVVEDFPRCPPYEAGFISHEHDHMGGCPMHVDLESLREFDREHLTNSYSPDAFRHEKNLLEALGWTGIDFGDILHYVGSLTTPPCSGPIEWFVQTKPIYVHDPNGDHLGCGEFAAQFPRADENEPPGNYRPPQPIKGYTKFERVNFSELGKEIKLGNECIRHER